MGVLVHPIPTTPGTVSPWVGLDQPIGVSVGATTVTRIFLKRTDEAGTVTAEIRNAGGDTLSVSMVTTDDANAATGSVAFAAGEDILLRVTAADAGSQNLGGSIDVESAGAVSTYLTTLARVKSFLAITDTSQDTILNELIPGISLAMEAAMARQIVQDSVTAEIHRINGGAVYELPLDEWPLISMSAVRENGNVIVEDTGYRQLPGGMIQRITGSNPSRISWAAGFVEADYTFGFASVPEDLVVVATAEVVNAWEQTKHGGSRLGKSGGSFPGQSDAQYFVNWQFLPKTKAILASYRRRL